jgi:TIR domain/MlaD protein
MGEIFISYAHEDRALAKQFAELLERKGHSVFWDRQIVPGATWDEVIERELNQARCVLVLWSKRSVVSKWVKTEAGEATDRSALIPVLIETAELPLRFKSIQTVNLVGWEGNETDAELQSLLQAVRKLVDMGAPGGGSASVLPLATPPKRRGRRRFLWPLILLTALAAGTLGLYETYQMAVRKGWFARKLAYLTLLRSAEGLAVGDPVTIDGRPVGEIIQIELMPPDSIFNVAVKFTIREPSYGFVWTDSRAVVHWNPSKTKRSIAVSRGAAGQPSYVFQEIADLPVKEALPALLRQEADLAQDVTDGTNLVFSALHRVSTNDIAKLNRLNLDRLEVIYRKSDRKEPTGVWSEQVRKYVPLDQSRWGFLLPSDEESTPTP